MEVMQEKKRMGATSPGQHQQFEQEIDIEEKIRFCRDWIPQRKWLKAMEVPFGEFPEEIRF